LVLYAIGAARHCASSITGAARQTNASVAFPVVASVVESVPIGVGVRMQSAEFRWIGILKKIYSEHQIQYDHGNGCVPIVKLNLALKYKQSCSLVLEDDIAAIVVVGCNHGRYESITVSSSVEVSKQSRKQTTRR
jgi:hypothetical protein